MKFIKHHEFKLMARKIKKEKKITQLESHDLMAKALGFNDYHHFIQLSIEKSIQKDIADCLNKGKENELNDIYTS